MHPLDAKVPKWPDFELRKLTSHERGLQFNQDVWRARTNTERPITPIFNLTLMLPRNLSEKEARGLARDELMARYEKAHPNGCPERKAENSNPNHVSDQRA